jgi:hypothetical protein
VVCAVPALAQESIRAIVERADPFADIADIYLVIAAGQFALQQHAYVVELTLEVRRLALQIIQTPALLPNRVLGMRAHLSPSRSGSVLGISRFGGRNKACRRGKWFVSSR